MSEQAPFVSVVVPVWNGEASVRACLEALTSQTYPRDRYEVLLIDNGSTDRTVEIARGVAGVAVLSEPAPGSYAARNTGLHQARGEIVAFTDADCAPRTNWLENGVRALCAHPESGVVGGHVALYHDGKGSDACAKYDQLFSMFQSASVERGQCATANWFARRDLMLAHGGFDASLKSGGDWELSARIAAAGRRAVFAPDAVVEHPARSTFDELARKRRRTVGGYWARSRTQPFPAVVLRQLSFDAKAAIRILRERALNPLDKLKVCGLRALLAGICVAELFRLRFGGEARRA